MTENRVTELEIKVAYQEDLLQDLNRIVIQQQSQIDRLDTICKQLTEHIRSLRMNPNNHPEDDQKPPHY